MIAAPRPRNVRSIEDKAPQPSLADRVYHTVLDQILRGTLPVGAVLSRRRLADQFKMSIVPVAEALQRLEIEGLLESRPQAGTRVKVPNAEEIRGRFDLRQALECESARLCAERASSQELLELKKLAANLDALQSKRAARNHDDDFAFRVNEHHVELHMRIAEYSHSEVLRAEIKKTHVLVFNWLYDTTREGRDLPPNFHAHLIQAIASGHPQKADDVMRAHVMIGLESTLNAMEPLQRLNWRVLPSRLAPIRRLPAATPTGR